MRFRVAVDRGSFLRVQMAIELRSWMSSTYTRHSSPRSTYSRTTSEDTKLAPYPAITAVIASCSPVKFRVTWGAGALRFSHPGTVIIGDNVIREGEVIQAYSTDPRVQGVRKFYDMLTEESRITATAIQTVGARGMTVSSLESLRAEC